MVKDGTAINIIVPNKGQSLAGACSNACSGIQHFFMQDRNGKIHIAAAAAVIIAGFLLHISEMEWVALLLCISAVIALEMINTAIEKLCDLVHKNYHPSVKFIKDVSAGAVLVASAISAVIGAVIFIPKIIVLL